MFSRLYVDHLVVVVVISHGGGWLVQFGAIPLMVMVVQVRVKVVVRCWLKLVDDAGGIDVGSLTYRRN